MSALFLKVLNISITAGWLVSAVLLLRFVLKKAPKWVRCMLWGLVALRLMLPFTIESKLSLLPSAEPIRTEAVSVKQADDTLEMPELCERVVVRSGIAAVDQAVNPVVEKTGTDAIGSILAYAPWVWAAGVCAMLVYAGASYLVMRNKVQASIETERNVFVCDEVRDPFILGAIFPRIYLPSGLDEISRMNVLAHERVHIRRLDHLWKPLGFLLLSIHWFNPFIWIAFILLSRDIEFACDEKVVSQLDAEGKASYSDTLLAFSRTHRGLALCPVAFGEVGVNKRIKSVLLYQKSALGIVFVAFLAAAAFAVCFLTSPVSAKAADTNRAAHAQTLSSEYRPPLPSKLAKKIANSALQEESDDKKAPVPINLMMSVNQNFKTAE